MASIPDATLHGFFCEAGFFELKSDEEIKAYLDEKMPRKSKQGVYNPKSTGTLNHAAYDYIIGELRDAQIPVLMVATPHHPYVNSYLSPGQLDGFNETFNRYANLSGVFGVNMYWEKWHSSMFRDRNHLGDVGREYLCDRLSPHIDRMLIQGGLEESVVQTDSINLSNFLEATCFGSDATTVIRNQLTFIQAGVFRLFLRRRSWLFRYLVIHEQRKSSWSGYLQALPEDVLNTRVLFSVVVWITTSFLKKQVNILSVKCEDAR